MTAALARSRYAGLAGSALIAAGGYGAGATPWSDPGPRWESSPGYLLGLGAWVVGLALMAVAWWRTGSQSPSGRWVVVTAVLWLLPLLLVSPLGSRDVYAYACQGYVYGHGLDPYAVAPQAGGCPWLDTVTPMWRQTVAPYGPLAVTLSAVAAATGHLLGALGVLRLVAVAGVAVAALAVPPLARACGTDPPSAAWLGLATPLVGIHLVAGAHHDALMLGLLLAALATATTTRSAAPAAPAREGHSAQPDATAQPGNSVRSGEWGTALAGVLIGLAVAVKVTAVVALPFVVLLARPGGRWVRTVLVAVVPAAAALGAVSLAAGLGFGWVHALPGLDAPRAWLSVPTGLGTALSGPFRLVGRPDLAATTLHMVRAVAWYALLPATLLALWWKARRTDDVRTILAACGLAFAALVALAPVVYPWYAAPALLLLATTTARRAVSAPAGTSDRDRTVAPAGTSDRDRTATHGRIVAGLTVGLAAVLLPDSHNIAHMTLWPGAIAELVLAIALAIGFYRRARVRSSTGS